MTDEPKAGILMASLVDRVIVRAAWRPTGDYPEGESGGTIWLDDGRIIEFGGWGHDWWGGSVAEVEYIDVDRCRHCGRPHRDLTIFVGQSYQSVLSGKRYAYCTDGNHTAWVEKSSANPIDVTTPM